LLRPLGARVSFSAKLIEDRVYVEGVPENDHVDYQAECAQLVFLSLAVALVEFAALGMKNDPPQAVPAFAETELLERASPARFVIDEVEHVYGIVDAADSASIGRRPGQNHRDLRQGDRF
jgi:hypothetical protein